VAAYLTFWQPPAPVASVSMSLVLRGAKKLQVGTVFGVCLTAVDTGTDLFVFLTVSEVSLEIRLTESYNDVFLIVVCIRSCENIYVVVAYQNDIPLFLYKRTISHNTINK
jgi:hypothetical protein